jgi:hypothetical protein
VNWLVGHGITGQGRVVRRDVTRYGLHRMRVELAERYPDLSIWSQALGPDARLLLHDYGERTSGPILMCWLILYWK